MTVSAEVRALMALLETGDGYQSLLQSDGTYRVTFWPRGGAEPSVAVRRTFDEAVRAAVGGAGMNLEHIGTIIARISPELAQYYARSAKHELKCPYWNRIDPDACTCSSRPVIDLLLHIVARKTA